MGSPTAGIFDASTSDYLYAELGNGAPVPAKGGKGMMQRPALISYFLTAALPLMLIRRSRRRGRVVCESR